jgi:hypothetical protein
MTNWAKSGTLRSPWAGRFNASGSDGVRFFRRFLVLRARATPLGVARPRVAFVEGGAAPPIEAARAASIRAVAAFWAALRGFLLPFAAGFALAETFPFLRFRRAATR